MVPNLTVAHDHNILIVWQTFQALFQHSYENVHHLIQTVVPCDAFDKVLWPDDCHPRDGEKKNLFVSQSTQKSGTYFPQQI